MERKKYENGNGITAFETILGAEKAARHKALINIILYGEIAGNERRKATKKEVEEFMIYDQEVRKEIGHYCVEAEINGEKYLIRGDTSSLRAEGWKVYEEHVERVKKDHNL